MAYPKIKVMHNNPQLAAKMMLEFLEKPEVTEKQFWRFLQDKVTAETPLKTSSVPTP